MRELSTSAVALPSPTKVPTARKPDHEDAYALRREYSQLEGGGYIGLGEDPRDMGDLAIRYDVDYGVSCFDL